MPDSKTPTSSTKSFLPQAIRICKEDEPVPEGSGIIEFLARQARKMKERGDEISKRANALKEALQAMKSEILMAQGGVDSHVESIAELLREAAEGELDDTPQDLPGPPQEDAPGAP